MWGSKEDAEEQKAKIERDLNRRRQRGEALEPLAAPSGKTKLSQTFWGQAWGRHLATYEEYAMRLPRGRSYLRQGHVYGLKIEPGLASAVVTGAEVYETRIHITPLSATRWASIVEACSGKVGSMMDLLAGKLGEDLLRVFADPEEGLFPSPREIRFDCTCPDYADMCKHAAAVLYGVGLRLDAEPQLLFTLRKVHQEDLLADAQRDALNQLHSEANATTLEGTDLSALFGIDLADDSGLRDQGKEPGPL